MKSVRVYLLISIIFGACSKETLIVEELQPYFDRFIEEAEKRGISFEDEDLLVDMRIGEIPENPSFLGICNYFGPDVNQEVLINILFWELLTPIEKEKLVFHELGHCILNRLHRNDKAANGFCMSIMNTSNGCFDNYSDETRDSYLDELFRFR